MTIGEVQLRTGGKPLDAETYLYSVEVRRELDRIPEARLVLQSGCTAVDQFARSTDADFKPGAMVEVRLRNGASDEFHTVFKGLVLQHGVEAHSEGTELRVELRDPAFVLTRRRRGQVFRDQMDHEVIKKLIKDANNADLTADAIAETRVKHCELPQFQVSDWDFLVSRADVNGLVVVVVDGKISARALTEKGDTRKKLKFGDDQIHELQLDHHGRDQRARISAVGLDLTTQDLSDPTSGDDKVTVAAGNLDHRGHADLAARLGGDEYRIVHAVPVPAAELKALADARLARSRFSAIRGRIVVDGLADIQPFDRVELEGVGERLSGQLLVSGVIHTVDQDGWRTELKIGLSPEWFARTPDIVEAPAAGLLPPAMGLHVGVVAKHDDDPAGEHRIKVRIPALDHADAEIWARVAQPDAGKDRGFAFWPQPGDEVAVGFFGHDPRHAVVLGSLFGSVNKLSGPAQAPSEDNDHRAIVTRSGTQVAFDDKRAAVTIKTPKGNRCVLDDDAESITLEDQHGNKIVMDSKGIKLESAGDFSLDAKGKVTIKGSATDIQ